MADTYPIVPMLAILGSKRRPGNRISPIRFIVAHDTGNPGASARNHAKWYRNDPNPAWVSSAHLFVDDIEIIETIPAFTNPERAYHVLYNVTTDDHLFGADANDHAIGVELCYGGSIDADQAYDRYVWLLAHLSVTYSLDPANRITGHHVLDPARKSDPKSGLATFGQTFENLLDHVAAKVRAMRQSAGTTAAEGSVGSAALKPGTARATVNLNRRKEPTSLSPRIGALTPGQVVNIAAVVRGERVMGIDLWGKIGEGDFCWSGGLA